MDAGSFGSIVDLSHRFPAGSTSSERNVDHCVNRPRPPARACRPDAAPGETATLGYRRTERTALYIETQEGDVVRLRIKVRDAVNGSARTEGGETPVTELAVAARSSVKIRFSVEGNLSAEELAAIENVVGQAAELAEDFFTGDVPDAFAAAAALDIDGDTLAHVGLRLSMRERLTYSGTFIGQLPQPNLPEPTSLPTAPAPAASALGAPTPMAEAPAAGAQPPPAAAEEATSVDASAAADVPAEAPTTPAPPVPVAVAASALATIAEFIGQLLDSLAAPPAAGEGAATASIDLSLRLRIFQAVVVNVAAVSQPAADATPAAGLPLVGDTLDALAASQRPLDMHA